MGIMNYIADFLLGHKVNITVEHMETTPTFYAPSRHWFLGRAYVPTGHDWIVYFSDGQQRSLTKNEVEKYSINRGMAASFRTRAPWLTFSYSGE